MSMMRVSDKVKIYVSKKAKDKCLSEGEILELELFGSINKKKLKR